MGWCGLLRPSLCSSSMSSSGPMCSTAVYITSGSIATSIKSIIATSHLLHSLRLRYTLSSLLVSFLAVKRCSGSFRFTRIVAFVVSSYTMYHLIEDHSGVKKTPIWPWQPTTEYHDNHHQYFHCNFGQHILLFDQLFGTLRNESKQYGEGVFGGGVYIKVE